MKEIENEIAKLKYEIKLLDLDSETLTGVDCTLCELIRLVENKRE